MPPLCSYVKYDDYWPHCANIECSEGTTVEMMAKCEADATCYGFSWTTSALYDPLAIGNGCMKKDCEEDGTNGYGYNSHGYIEKTLGCSPPPPLPAPPAPAPPVSMALHGDPMFKMGGVGKHLFLPVEKLTPTLSWKSADGHKMELSLKSIEDEPNQWIKQVVITQDKESVLDVEAKETSFGTMALLLDKKQIHAPPRGPGDSRRSRPRWARR